MQLYVWVGLPSDALLDAYLRFVSHTVALPPSATVKDRDHEREISLQCGRTAFSFYLHIRVVFDPQLIRLDVRVQHRRATRSPRVSTEGVMPPFEDECTTLLEDPRLAVCSKLQRRTLRFPRLWRGDDNSAISVRAYS